MTQITDLTWQQLIDASTFPSLVVVDPTLGLMLNLSLLTGVLNTSSNAKESSGVVQALFKLREIAATAQSTVNVGKNIGDRLAAFPPVSNGTAVSGFVMSSGQIVVKTPLASSGIVGATN